MTLKDKQLESLLVDAFIKKVPSQHVPSEITEKIMMYYYYSVHKQNFPLDLVMDQAFRLRSVRNCDPENTCQTFLKCNCCKRHQKQKGNVYTSDKTGELEVSIITKPEALNPDFEFTGKKPPTRFSPILGWAFLPQQPPIPAPGFLELITRNGLFGGPLLAPNRGFRLEIAFPALLRASPKLPCV